MMLNIGNHFYQQEFLVLEIAIIVDNVNWMELVNVKKDIKGHLVIHGALINAQDKENVLSE
jgi:hypothetical protein